jgi:hypothetical protein
VAGDEGHGAYSRACASPVASFAAFGMLAARCGGCECPMPRGRRKRLMVPGGGFFGARYPFQSVEWPPMAQACAARS